VASSSPLVTVGWSHYRRSNSRRVVSVENTVILRPNLNAAIYAAIDETTQMLFIICYLVASNTSAAASHEVWLMVSKSVRPVASGS
jgi:hypothetical protein